MSTPEQDPHDPTDQRERPEDGPTSDFDLLRSTPLRVSEWLLAPLVLALAGGAVVAVLIGMALQHGLPLSGWASLPVAGLAVAYAGRLAWYGYRAYAQATPVTSASLLRFQVAGFSALATVAILAGVIGASFVLVMMGLGATVALFGKFRNRPLAEGVPPLQRSLARIVRRAFLADGVILVVAAIAAGLVALTGPDVSSHASSQYIAYAIVLPVVGVILIVCALRLGRSDESRQTPSTH